MDTSERDDIARDLGDIARERDSLRSSLQQQQQQQPADLVAQGHALRAEVKELQKRQANLIPEGANSEAGVDEWQRVSTELRANQNGNTSSRIAPSTLPTVHRTQANRVRLEEENRLLIRQPLFSQYESAIFPTASQFFGLTGPQGFGKSAFLQYLAAKYCYGSAYLTVYLPDCPTQTKALKIALARAFYRGSRIAGFTGYKELTLLDGLDDMVRKCIAFATSKSKTLLLVIDQMKGEEPQNFFHPTINAIRHMNATNIKVVISSSTSHMYSSIFGQRFWNLERYSRKLTLHEATLLASHYSHQGTVVTAEELSELPFQVAAEKISQMQASPTMAQVATDLAEDLLRNLGNARKKQIYYCLQFVAEKTRMAKEAGVSFGTVLDGDYFYIESDEGGYYIAEHRQGFADTFLTILRSRHAYQLE